MKTLILSLLLFCGNLFALDPCFTGSWQSDEFKYEGINIEALPNTTVVYWYTYSFFDRDNQNWILFVGPDNRLTAYDTVPYGFDPILYEVGDGEIEVVDNNTIIFSYDFLLDLDVDDPEVVTPWCFTDLCEGSIEFTRFTQPVACVTD